MKVLFLDIDGVLNHGKSRGNNPNNVDATCADNLFFILARTGCKLVISSSWRVAGLDAFRRDFQNALFDAHVDADKIHRILDSIIGLTPDLWKTEADRAFFCRGDEIQAWLDDNGPVERFCIVDDYDDMLDLKPFLVQTDDAAGGLTFKLANDIVGKLLG